MLNLIALLSPIVQAYPGDEIMLRPVRRGNKPAIVVLPFELGEIRKMQVSHPSVVICDARGENITIRSENRLYDGKPVRYPPALLQTKDSLFITPTRTDKSGLVTHLQVNVQHREASSVEQGISLLQAIHNPNFHLDKQLYVAGTHILSVDQSATIFHVDKNDRNVFWENRRKDSVNTYLIPSNGTITIGGANGILDFSTTGLDSIFDLNVDVECPTDMEGNESDQCDQTHHNDTVVSCRSQSSTSRVILRTPRSVTVTVDGQKYYTLRDGKLIRHYHSHPVTVKGTKTVDAKDLMGMINSIRFHADKINISKLGDDLLLSAIGDALLIKDYSSIHGDIKLSIRLNSETITPTEFVQRVNQASKQLLRYYEPIPGGELTLFHNLPDDMDAVGILNLNNTMLERWNIRRHHGALTLVNRWEDFVVRVEGWNRFLQTRNILLYFGDCDNLIPLNHGNAKETVAWFKEFKRHITTQDNRGSSIHDQTRLKRAMRVEDNDYWVAMSGSL